MPATARAQSPRELPREFRAGLRAAAVAVVTVLLVAAIRALGGVAALDERIDAGEAAILEGIGVSHEPSDAVLIVAGDPATVAAWGTPPWPRERLEALLAAIAAGRPEQVVVLGHAPMFVPSEDPRLVQGESSWVRVDERRPGAWGRRLALGPDATLRELGRRSERVPPIPATLPIAWASAPRVASLPAHAVADGRLPAATFTGRVIVLGLTDPAHARLLATSRGRQSPVEVEARALAGLLDERPGPLGPWQAWAVDGLLAFALVVGLRRASIGAVLRGAGVGLLGLAGIDLLACAAPEALGTGLPRLGLAGPGLTLLVAAIVYALAELAAVRARVEEAGRTLADALAPTPTPAPARAEPEASPEPGSALQSGPRFWSELAEAAADHASALLGGPVAVTLLERRGRSHALEARASAGGRSSPGTLPFDLRRSPLRGAWLTGRAGWSALGSPRGRVVVPLLAVHAGLLGVAVIEPNTSARPSATALAGCDRLGRLLADTIVRRRRRQAVGAGERAWTLADALAQLDAGLTMVRDEHRWTLDLIAALPVRVAIATIGGELEWVDPRLRRALGDRCPGLFLAGGPDPHLVDVLARLTGARRPDARARIREVVLTGAPVALPVARGDWWLVPLELPAERPGLAAGAVAHLALLDRRPPAEGRR